MIEQVSKINKLPVPNFSAGGIATPADAALMMHLGAEAVFVGSGIFKSEIPKDRAKSIVKAVTHYEDAKILAHPECEENILVHADFIGSTSALIKNVNETNDEKYIIATEPGVIHQMQKNNPNKQFIPLPSNNGCACNECPHMKRNTLEKLYLCMRDQRPELTMDESLRSQALKPIQRMLELS